MGGAGAPVYRDAGVKLLTPTKKIGLGPVAGGALANAGTKFARFTTMAEKTQAELDTIYARFKEVAIARGVDMY